MSKKKMFCFTYAGGNASFYNQLEDSVKDKIEIIKMEYAGHGMRHKESFYANFLELAEDMYDILKAHCNQNTIYALMGYSMGTIAVIEVLKKIIEEDEIPLPKHIFLAAHEPEARSELKNFCVTEEDELIKQRTIQFGGIPESLVNSRSFWRVYLPIYKADYRLIREYDFDKLDMKSEIPITVFYSEEDTPLSKMKKWQNFFIGECKFENYEGNHFFINKYCNDIANIIKNNLRT